MLASAATRQLPVLGLATEAAAAAAEAARKDAWQQERQVRLTAQHLL
jgi:post-segregation antitoxin (ccd killing protein)